MSGWARPALIAALAASLLGGAVSAQDFGLSRRDRDPDRYRRANPSAVVAAELAFAREAQEKGQWTAFAKFADDDAVMFVPQAVRAKDWLKGRANPVNAVRWQPHQVWSSCDGTLAVTKGAWQRADGSVGYFTTVWKRQRDGNYEWVMDQGDGLQQPLAEPEMIGGSVAECQAGAGDFGPRERGAVRSARITAPACTESLDRCHGGGTSADGTLAYDFAVEESGAREFTVRLRQQGAMQEVLRSEVAAQ